MSQRASVEIYPATKQHSPEALCTETVEQMEWYNMFMYVHVHITHLQSALNEQTKYFLIQIAEYIMEQNAHGIHF